MSRDAAQRVIVYAATILIGLTVVHAYFTRGGPFFAQPATVMEHAEPSTHYLHPIILTIEDAESSIPRGATVTCFRPADGAMRQDNDCFLPAVGLLPHHRVVPVDANPDFALSIGAPMDDPHYELLARTRLGGWLYVRRH